MDYFICLPIPKGNLLLHGPFNAQSLGGRLFTVFTVYIKYTCLHPFIQPNDN